MSIFSFDEHGRMTSISKAPGVKVDEELGSVSSMLVSQIQKDLTAVELSDEHAELFERALFPPNRLTKKHSAMANPPRPAQFAAFGLGLANLNMRLKIYIQILVSLMERSDRINQASVIGGQFMATVVSNAVSTQLTQLAFLNNGGSVSDAARTALISAMQNTDGVSVEKLADGFRISNVAHATSENKHGHDASGGLWNTCRAPTATSRSSSEVYITPNGVGSFMTTGSSPEFEKDPTTDSEDVSQALRSFYFSGYMSTFGRTVHAAMENLHKVLFGDLPSKANIKS